MKQLLRGLVTVLLVGLTLFGVSTAANAAAAHGAPDHAVIVALQTARATDIDMTVVGGDPFLHVTNTQQLGEIGHTTGDVLVFSLDITLRTQAAGIEHYHIQHRINFAGDEAILVDGQPLWLGQSVWDAATTVTHTPRGVEIDIVNRY